MAKKHKKKRNKKYQGADAAQSRPTITRVQAVSRSAPRQWAHEKRHIIKTSGVIILIVLIIILIISGIFSLF